MRETLGNRMSKKLKEYGISQRLLATLTRTTEVSVSRYVNDKRIPKADVLYRIACALHTTTDYLLGLTTSEQTNEEWFTSLSTEEKAKFIFWQHFDVYGKTLWELMVNASKGVARDKQAEVMIGAVVEWLKEIHNG